LAAELFVAPVDERLTVPAGRGIKTPSTSLQGFVPAPPTKTRSPTVASVFPWAFAYLIVAAGLTFLYYLFPAYHSPLWTALGLSAVAATVAGVRRNRPRQPLAWYLLAAAELTFIAGDTSYNVLTQIMHQDNPFPSVADLFYLLTYVFIASGIFLIIRARCSSRDLPSLIDAVIITTGLGLLSWVYLIVPNFQADGLDWLQRAVSVAYPVGDVLILAMLARLVAGGGLRFGSMRFLMIGAMGIMAADVLYGLIQINGVWEIGGPVDIGWALFYATWGAAALHPSMRRLTDIAPLASVGAGRARLTLLALASLIAPGVLLVQSVRHTNIASTTVATVAVFSATLFVLVLARMSGVVNAHQQSIVRERALRTSSEALVAASGLPDIYRAALAGVTSLVGGPALQGAWVYLAESEGIRCVANSATTPQLPDERALWDAAQGGGYLSQSGTLSVNPLRYDLEDRGMLITEGKTALTVDQHHALSTLASQVALAVVSATLAEELHQRKSQEQFRGMIQNASEIIVVVDDFGRIKYGTPSLERELGHPVGELLGTPLSDLLHPDEVVMADALLSGMAGRSSQAPSVTDWRLRRADGRYLFFEVLTSNLLDDLSVTGIVLTMRNVTERRALEQQLTHQAFHDTLTGLPNRALFQDRVEHALARAVRRGTTLALAMIDLDDFKVVNDTRGHGAGDAMLREVGRRLKMTLRSSTTIARLGGDEFAVLFEDLDDLSQARYITERILQPFRTPFALDGEDLLTSASVGLVVSGESGVALNFTELLRCADLALYAAKERGKGRVEVYQDDLLTRMVSRATQRSELSTAMQSGQFEMHYQPVVLIDTGEIVGSEALIRWRHPTRGLVMPGEFITMAEETGQIVELGRWVLEHACTQWRVWADQGHASHRLSVNVSARQLQESSFADEVRSVLLRHDMSPAALVLELTESIFALDGPKILEQLTIIRDLGVRLAVDDFGTGYSSLSYLQQFKIDEVKVDKSFVDGLGSGNGDDGALANAIVSMAHSLRLEVVAEGIERAAQRDELWSMGCGLGQGYMYSRPVSSEDLLRLLTLAEPLGNPSPTSGGARVARLRTPAPIDRLHQASVDACSHPQSATPPCASDSTPK
jgi:diguanylate cyclase (GGDEF)-like protein/PAS domain S-box-containing protein